MADVLTALSEIPESGIVVGDNVYSRDDIVRAIVALKHFDTINGQLGIATHRRHAFDELVDTSWTVISGDWNQADSVYSEKAQELLDPGSRLAPRCLAGMTNWVTVS